MPNIPIFSIWGSDDKLVNKIERSSLIKSLSKNPNFKYEIVKDGKHILRFIYPKSIKEYKELNTRITQFFVNNM